MAGLAPELIRRGWDQFCRMAGRKRAEEVCKEWHRISPEFETFALGTLSGQLWTRRELDPRTRSLVTIAALAALGRSRGLALNIEMALRNGATQVEIRECLLQMAFYAGFPAAWEGLQVAHEVFRSVRRSENPSARSSSRSQPAARVHRTSRLKT